MRPDAATCGAMNDAELGRGPLKIEAPVTILPVTKLKRCCWNPRPGIHGSEWWII